MTLAALAAFGLLIALACSADNAAAPSSLQLAPSLAILAGDAQVDTVSHELPAAIAARLTDKETAAPVPGILVNWVVASGGGNVFAGAAITDAQGMARERWTLGPSVGDQVLEARAVDATGAPIVYARATAKAVPAAAAVFDLAGPYRKDRSQYGADPIAAGDSFLVAIVWGDRFGNITQACADGGALDRIAWAFAGTDTLTAVGLLAIDKTGIGWQEFVHAGAGGTVVTIRATSPCVPDLVANLPIRVEHALPAPQLVED